MIHEKIKKGKNKLVLIGLSHVGLLLIVVASLTTA